jgi:hypothetical protein
MQYRTTSVTKYLFCVFFVTLFYEKKESDWDVLERSISFLRVIFCRIFDCYLAKAEYLFLFSKCPAIARDEKSSLFFYE